MESTATNRDVLDRTAAFIQETLGEDCTGHDWHHVGRVRQTALYIGKEEGADLFVVELAALLHDVADWKFHDGDESAGPTAARNWLEKLKIDEATIDHVCDIVAGLSFKGAGVATEMKTLEGKAVQDADRLDALGAIGIARTFAYGGHKGQPIYDPDLPPTPHDSFEAYKSSNGTSINHFYEKLLLLKDRMNTPTAQRIAEQRHNLMEQFLQKFFQEQQGEDYATSST